MEETKCSRCKDEKKVHKDKAVFGGANAKKRNLGNHSWINKTNLRTSVNFTLLRSHFKSALKLSNTTLKLL